MKNFAIVVLCLALASCGKAPEAPTPELMEATVDIGGTQTTLKHGVLCNSPYATPDNEELDLVLVQSQQDLETYLDKTLQHKAPAIINGVQLSVTLRPVDDSGAYDAEIHFTDASGAEAILLAGFAPKGVEDLPFPDRFPGEYEKTTVDGQTVWHLTLEHEETEDDGTVNRVSIEVKAPQMLLAF